MARKLKPLQFLLPDESEFKLGLILLNNKIEEDLALIKQIWKYAKCKLFVDGASNRMYDLLQNDKEKYLPDIVSGDFDSARPEVLEFYRSKGCEIVHTPDQDATDFTKGFQELVTRFPDSEANCYLVIGVFGGRVDHVFANISTLYQLQPLTTKPIYCVSEGDLGCLLSKGKSIIDISTGQENKYCGLVPVGHPCYNVTTSGLLWNLNGQKLEFGDLISTSNGYGKDAKEVTIETDNSLLWTMDYNRELHK